jgi:hypothetical protein
VASLIEAFKFKYQQTNAKFSNGDGDWWGNNEPSNM